MMVFEDMSFLFNPGSHILFIRKFQQSTRFHSKLRLVACLGLGNMSYNLTNLTRMIHIVTKRSPKWWFHIFFMFTPILGNDPI